MSSLAERSAAFLTFLEEWQKGLKPLSLAEAAPDPARAAIFSADIVNGFCYTGNLASPRVAALVPPIVSLFQRAHAYGVRDFVLVQDTHSEHAEEFNTYPLHCVRGTLESDMVKELRDLSFSHTFTIVRKNSLHPAIGTDFDAWVDTRPSLQTAIVVGDCTDLCTYHLAMHLKLRANARDQKLRVILPANCVDTYDLPVATAKQIGALPHDGDFLHTLFLYQMALNGIEVVKEIT